MARARPTDWRNPDYTAVFAQRTQKWNQLKAANAWDAAWTHYKSGHYADFIEDWCFTYDPRNVNRGLPAFVPFVLFDHQRVFVDWMTGQYRGRKGGLVEKSRDMGASWVALAWAVCLWLFEPGVKISVGSRKESLVDTLGDPDSLLEKVRILIRELPKEFQPLGWNEAAYARHMKIVNPENGAVITGEAGDNIGRGGRSSVYLLDEAAFVENPEKAEAALSQNTDCRFDISTPNGVGNPFYMKRFGGAVEVFTFHWTKDPRKDDVWYARQCATLDPRVLAQEVDLDYESSGDDTVIMSKWVRASVSLRKHYEGKPEWTALRGKHKDGIGGLDVGGGRAYSVFVPRHGPIVSSPTAWKTDDSINTAFRGVDLAAEAKCKAVKFDSVGVGKGVMSALKRQDRVRAIPVNTGSSPSHRRWPDGKMSKDKFTNLKAELWWTLRERLQKTFEHFMYLQGQGGTNHPLDELLFLPDNPKLNGELPLPGYTYLESGKIQIERKTRMAARGVQSPDHADALVLTLAPPPARARSGLVTGFH
jgi:phage terminase large subunit